MADSINKIEQLLSRNKSWSDNVIQFGSLDETCMELIYSKRELKGVKIRIDLRNIKIDIMKSIITIINENDALMLLPNGSILEPELDYLLDEIKKSDAYRFVKNPKEFFNQLKLS